MLPFVRMLEYGNVNPGLPEIKKMQGFGNGIYVLYENGELYGTGASAHGLLMTTSTTQLKKWKLLSTEVDYFWVCDYGAVFKMKDGKWMYLGNERILGTGTLSTKYIAFHDISSSLSFLTYDVSNPGATKIGMNFDGMFYLHGTDLYGRGANSYYSLGLGNTSARPAFTPIALDVLDYSVQDLSVGCMYVNTSKAYYYAGNDGSAWLKNNTFKLFMNSAYDHIGFNGVSDGWQVYSTGEAWAYGANTYKSFGVSGGSSPLLNPTLLTNSSVILSKNPKVSISAGEFTSWLLLDDGLYACGNAVFGAGGAFTGTSQVYLPSILPSNVLPSDITFYSTASGTSLFCTKNTLYYTGSSEALPGVSVASPDWEILPAIKDNLL